MSNATTNDPNTLHAVDSSSLAEVSGGKDNLPKPGYGPPLAPRVPGAENAQIPVVIVPRPWPGPPMSAKVPGA